MNAAAPETAPERRLSLMELVAEYERIFAEIDEAEGEVTEEVGARMDAFNADFETKVEAYALVITLRASRVKATDHVVKTYTDRRDRQQRGVDALKKRLYDSMKTTGKKKIETPTATIAIQANGQAALVIEGPVPAEYLKPGEPDNAKIREAIAATPSEVSFAKLVRGEHVRIR